MAEFAVLVTKTVNGIIVVEADDEFAARCVALDMPGDQIEQEADWYEDYIEISDNIEPYEGL